MATDRLGPFELLEPLGEGGMGRVFKGGIAFSTPPRLEQSIFLMTLPK
jgi:hypothetical protein